LWEELGQLSSFFSVLERGGANSGGGVPKRSSSLSQDGRRNPPGNKSLRVSEIWEEEKKEKRTGALKRNLR